MGFLSDFLARFVTQLQSPTLGFLIGGLVVAAVNSRLTIPDELCRKSNLYAKIESNREQKEFILCKTSVLS